MTGINTIQYQMQVKNYQKYIQTVFSPFSIFFLIFCIFTVKSFGSESYHWRSFTKLDGLISNDVNDIAQDYQGNIWFATGAGVSRYDGLWHNYTIRDGLCDNNATGVVVDESGRVWVGTDEGICYFDGFRFRTSEITESILYLSKSIHGEIWAGTDRGAIRFDGDNWIYWTQSEGHLQLGITAVFGDSTGKVWFGIKSYPAQLSCFDGDRWINYSVNDGLPTGRIMSICEDTDGNIWIGTSDGAAKFDGNLWTKYTVADGLAGNSIREISVERNGVLWFATSDGISVFDDEKWNSIRKEDGIVSNDIQAVLEDRQEGIWIGTGDRGISYTDRKWISVTSESVLPDNTINSIFEDSNGNMWLGTPEGLVKFDGEQWNTITTGDGLPGNQVRDITEIVPSSQATTARNTELWVGTDKGVGVYDGISWNVWTAQSGGLSGDSIHTVYSDSSGNVWVGTGLYERDGLIDLYAGLSKFDGESWVNMPPPNSTVSCILEDSHGILWICTYNDGIKRINGDSIVEIRTEDGLASNSVFSAVELPNGDIWFGTDRGISITSTRLQSGVSSSDTWTTLTTDDGLADNRVRTLFLDRLNQIWIGTADGVSVLRENRWIQYNVADGLISNSVKSISVSNNGEVWFGTDESGLTRHIREEIPPKTRIINRPTGIIGVRTVTFEYIGGDASTPTEELLYSYSLNNAPWSSFIPKNFVTFSNLEDKENHYFTVRAKDKDGNIDPIGAKAYFTIDASPPFVEIDVPLENQIISGICEITGSTIDETDFKEYRVETTNFSTGWVKSSVKNGVLALWDTRDLADGIYTINLSARDKIDGESDIQHENQTEVKVEVDNTKPDVKIISPVSNIESSGIIEVEAEIEDKNLKSYRLSYMQFPSDNWKQIYFVESSVSEKIKSEFPLWDSSNVYGETTLRVSAEDEAGNVGFDDVKLFLKNDSAKPVVEINSPVQNSVIRGDFTIMGTVQDTSLKEFCLEYSYGNEYKEIRRGNYPIDNDAIAIWNTELLSDGNYIIRLTATDDNGYRSSVKYSIKIDNTKPSASIDLPEEIVQGSVNTEIIGTAYDENFNQARLEYASLEEPEQWNLIGEPIINAKQNELLKIWNSSGYEGKYQIRLTVIDQALNESIDTKVITVDSSGIQLEIVEPTESEVVSGEVSIIGSVRDANFKYYSLYFREESSGEWQNIVQKITEQKENEPVGIWNTQGLNGVFSVKLSAEDLSGKSSEIEVNRIRVDNLPPVVSFDYPKDNQQIGDIVKISGTATDDNLSEYVIEYRRKDVKPIDWDSISPVPFSKNIYSGHLGTWSVPSQPGEYVLRLKATDLAEHENETALTVILPQILDAKEGGMAIDEEERAWIEIPPNSLPSSTVITINKVEEGNLSEYSCIYDFEPKLVFNSLKPATITISYSSKQQNIHSGQTPSVFSYESDINTWKEIGGTVNNYKKEVTVAIHKTGRYALGWIESEELQSQSDISNLTCQPRVFRPNTGQMAISFSLSSSAEVTVKIYNTAGRLKRILKDNDVMRRGSNVIYWDAVDEYNRKVPSGLYIVTVQTEKQVTQKSLVVWND